MIWMLALILALLAILTWSLCRLSADIDRAQEEHDVT